MTDLIKKLQNIKIEDLQHQLDLSQFDFVSLGENLLRRKDIVVDIVVIVITLIAGQATWKNYLAQTQLFAQEIRSLEEKNDAIKDYATARAQLDHFLKDTPDGIVGVTAIINKISDFANENNIRLVSFTPKQTISEMLFTEDAVEFTVETDRYDRLQRFIAAMEASADKNLRLESWKRNAQASAQIPSERENSGMLSCTFVVVSTNIKRDLLTKVAK